MTATRYLQPLRSAISSSVWPASVVSVRLAMTDALAELYADRTLSTPLPNPLQSDAGSRLPAIYCDPDELYDIDVVDLEGDTVIEETDFRPTLMPLSLGTIFTDETGSPIPNATLTVYRVDTTILAEIWANQAGTVPRENPVSADEFGDFPTIYVTVDEALRVLLHDGEGQLIYDFDTTGLDEK